MAVLNVRVDDDVRDGLKDLADQSGVSLSEYVRELLLAAVEPLGPREGSEYGDEPAPESLRLIDRQVLSLLHRILGRVLPDDSNDVDGDEEYQLKRAQILEQGFTGAYWYETAGFSTELSKRNCDQVSDILQMFRILTYSITHEEERVVVPDDLKRRLEFRGFDHNHPLEAHMASYVRYLTTPEGHWSELKPQIERNDDGNSHSPALHTYQRMLAEYRRIVDDRERTGRDDYLLTMGELERVATARIHPSRRTD